MNSKTFLSILIMLFFVLSMITYYKMKDFPTDSDCCKNIKNPSSTVCLKCNDYNFIEKIVYVWKFS
ncbi:MAG: hypothetical protein GX265_00030 [Mollicutes bacterium]|nr:hypothetical protein [Mollicutes bacterium]